MRAIGVVLVRARHPISILISAVHVVCRSYERLCEHYPVLGEWIGFTAWETLSTGVFYAVLLFLMELCGLSYLSSVVVAFPPAVTADFVVQRSVIFHSDPTKWRRQLAWFILKEVLLYIAGTLIVEIGIDRFALWYLPVQFGTTAGIGLISFICSLTIFER